MAIFWPYIWPYTIYLVAYHIYMSSEPAFKLCPQEVVTDLRNGPNQNCHYHPAEPILL